MASGDILWVCEPLAGIAPDTDPAGLAFIDGNDTALIPVLTFDPGATNEEMDWKCFMPAHYDGGGVTVVIVWSADDDGAAGTEVVRWNTAFKSIGNDDTPVDAAAFATAKEANDTEPTVTDEVTYAEINHATGAEMDNIAAGEMFFFRLARDSSDTGNDTCTHDAEVHQVIIKEQ